jgi:ribA/ribD-fused uncharacterized protein
MKYSIQSIVERKDKEFLFFWGHQPSRDGSIIKTCLSQWWPSSFLEDEIIYKTAEHYMMAQKAKLFGDEVTLNRILHKDSPKDVKDLGRQIQHFDAQIWDQNKFKFVCKGNYLKFSQNEELKHFLLQTKSKILVEASPVDAIWGIGLKEDHPNANNPELWRGENLLGFALMEVRDQLTKNI